MALCLYRMPYIIAGIDAVIRMWVICGFSESVDEIVAVIQRAREQPLPAEKC